MRETDPAPVHSATLIIACWIAGVLGTAMGGGAWIVILHGGRVYHRNTGTYLSLGESALIATGILALGLLFLRLAHGLTPPAP
jgi:hypothetical protein